jgi:uncharacterized protein YcbX
MERHGPSRALGDTQRVEGRVAWIHVAPVKALAIDSRREAYIGPLGVEGDRRFVIVDPETNKMLNAKRIAMLVSIRPELDDGHLTLHLPDGSKVRGDVALGDPGTITIFSREAGARPVDGPFSDALSKAAGRPLRLVRLENEGQGVDRSAHGGAASLLSEESLRAIASAGGADRPVDPRRFRMLIGVSGVPAHTEDSWIGEQVHVGEAMLVPAGNVGRCAVTTVDPESGVSDFDTLAAIAKYRGEKVTTEALPFGVWARVAKPGRVRLGDPVHVA